MSRVGPEQQRAEAPGGAGVGIVNTRSVGVVFAANGKWAIVNLDNTAMPVGAAYNVLVVKQ